MKTPSKKGAKAPSLAQAESDLRRSMKWQQRALDVNRIAGDLEYMHKQFPSDDSYSGFRKHFILCAHELRSIAKEIAEEASA